MVDVNIFLALLTVASVAVYFYIKRLYSYWDRIGVKSFAPTFPFGNLAKNVRQKLSIGELIAEFYRNTSERFVGIYSCLRPNLILCDPELIRNVCGRDFKYFYHRGFNVDEKIDPMTANVLFANGEKWKILREKLSPAFTSGKVKSMFDTIKDSGKSLHKYMDRHADTNAAVDIRDIFARFATNIIASVAFGIDIDCIVNPNEDFRRRGAQIFELNLKNTLRQFLAMTSPFLSRLFKVRFIDKSVEDFMTAIVQQNIEFREKNNFSRNDFFQLLIGLYRRGTIQNDDKVNTTIDSKSSKPLTLSEITAQALIFFAASFETSSSTMAFCLYELAKNGEIQRKVQEEISAAGEITYESVENMKYLESCIDETLRKYSPVTIITRKCMENYRIHDSEVTIEKGTSIFIPVFGIHRDPKYYPEPEKFDPDRFSAENSAGKTFLNRPYMPFGSGQRLCMGVRLGKMQVKVGLILMLQKYNFTLGAKHLEEELELCPKTFISTPKYGLPLIAKRRAL